MEVKDAWDSSHQIHDSEHFFNLLPETTKDWQKGVNVHCIHFQILQYCTISIPFMIEDEEVKT